MNTLDAITSCFRFRSRHDNLPMVPAGTYSRAPADRNTLAGLFGKLGFTEGVEIGTRKGEFAVILCQRNLNLHLTCVDPWAAYSSWTQDLQDAYYACAVTHLKVFPNVTVLRKTSMEAVGEFKDGSLDFVYIDGNHVFDYVMLDILYWQHKVKSGGIIALHDYCQSYRGGVVAAVEAYTRSHHIDPWFLTREPAPTAFWVKL